jgi:formyl-CoA transferase
MQDSILHYIRNAFCYMERTEMRPAPRAGDKTVGGGWPPIGVYPTNGGGPNDYVYIFTSPANPDHWNRLLKLMGREDLLGDKRYDTPAARTEHREEVDALVANWTKSIDKHTAWKLVSGAGVPAGAVLDTREIADDKNFEERGIRQTMKHPQGNYTMSGWPVRFGGATPAVRVAPELGQHSANVLGDWLGMDSSAIAELKAGKVIAG